MLDDVHPAAPVEFVELTEPAGHADPAGPVRRFRSRLPRKTLAAAALLAVVVALASVLATRPHPLPAVAPAVPAPTGLPWYPTFLDVSPAAVDAVCPAHDCTAQPLPARTVRRYLYPFGWPQLVLSGATVVDPHGRVRGRLGHVVLTGGVTVDVYVTPAAGSAPAAERRSQLGAVWTVTLGQRRDGWDLTAALHGVQPDDPVVAAARDWLADSTLPDATQDGAG